MTIYGPREDDPPDEGDAGLPEDMDWPPPDAEG